MIKKLLICVVCAFVFSGVILGVSSHAKQPIQVKTAASEKIEVSAAVAAAKRQEEMETA